MTTDNLRGVILAGGLSLLSACAVTPRGAGDSVPAAACLIADSRADSVITVAVHQAVLPANAPVPRNAAERFVFGQLYETLVASDCEGRPVPGLAVSWSADETGRVWQFRLRPGATFQDMRAASPASVVESWLTTLRRGEDGVAGVTARGDVLRVEFDAPADVSFFQRPELGIARITGASGWPSGTGVYDVQPVTDPRTTVLAARHDGVRAPRVIRFRYFPANDPRGALDAGADLLLTTDPATLDYARLLSDYSVVPAGWSHTYVLAARSVPVTGADPAQEAGMALAVRGSTRPAEQPFWWTAPDCRPAALRPPREPDLSRDASTPRRVVYVRDDAVARSIAERIVALAWPAARAPDWATALLRDMPATQPPVVEALTEQRLAEALNTGSLLAAVVAVPRTLAGYCPSARAAESPAAAAVLQTVWRVTPLVDVQQYMIHRGAPGRLTVDGEGTLRFGGGAQ